MKKTTKTAKTKKPTVSKTKISKEIKFKLIKNDNQPQRLQPFEKFIKFDHHINPENKYNHNNIRTRKRVA
ncbi:MAG: hypothetical protein IPM57_07195 [Oligoflexia bacterium]|nr:hypothetical protein [Oligoflexia bacterium]